MIRRAFAALLLYFAARGLYLAFQLAPGMPPDELTHLGLCEIYAGAAWLPVDSAGTFHLGVVAHQPYLYYLLMGKLLHLNVTPLSDLGFLRLANLALGWATLAVAWRWIRLFSADLAVRIFFLVIVTNTLMWTALFASVSYDNLVNLLAATSIYTLTRTLGTKQAGALLGLGLSLLAGCLTKLAFLPFAAILVGCLLVNEWRGLAALRRWLRGAARPRAAVVASALALVVLLAANLALYGGNLVRFERLTPSPRQVIPEAEIMRNPNLARDDIVARYRRGDLAFDEAAREARRIPERSLQRDTFYLLSAEQRRRSGAEASQPLSRASYTVQWAYLMSQRVFGFMGQEHFFHSNRALAVYWGIAALAALVFVGRALNGRLPTRLEWTLLAVAALYALVVMQLVNYPTYRRTNVLILAVQGRYLFPVMLPVSGLLARFGVGWGPTPLRWVLAAAGALWFVAAELPLFLWEGGARFFVSAGG